MCRFCIISAVPKVLKRGRSQKHANASKRVQMSAKERKKSPQGHKREQKSVKELFCIINANNKLFEITRFGNSQLSLPLPLPFKFWVVSCVLPLPCWLPQKMSRNFPKGPKIENFNLAWNLQSRLKSSISLENFNLDLHNPHKNRGLVGGALESFNLAWKFQSWRAILKFFKLWALRVYHVMIAVGMVPPPR